MIDDDDETDDYLQTWSAKTCNYQRQRLGNTMLYTK